MQSVFEHEMLLLPNFLTKAEVCLFDERTILHHVVYHKAKIKTNQTSGSIIFDDDWLKNESELNINY